MKIICYEPHYNAKHRRVLRAFADGCGAEVRDVRNYQECDVAVLFGAKKDSFTPTWSKDPILKRHKGRKLVMIESAFVKRGEYWQVGFGGFSGHADFRNEDSPNDRWEALGVAVLPWQSRPQAPVVVCGQVPWDTQVQGVDHRRWCCSTVNWFRQRNIEVKFRPHPRLFVDGRYKEYGVDEELCDLVDLQDALSEAKCFVTWNSTSAVDALIAGVPVVACNEGSIAWPLAVHRLEDTCDLVYPNRSQWFANLGYAQWSLKEMRSGQVWSHLMRK